MAKKKVKLTTVCQDCLNDIPDKVIKRYMVSSVFGPDHYIFICKNCLIKREKKNGSN